MPICGNYMKISTFFTYKKKIVSSETIHKNTVGVWVTISLILQVGKELRI